MWIVRFEFVSPNTHPEYYLDEAPLGTVEEVKEFDWTAVATTHATHPNAVEHFRGLKELIRRGELIRNVKIRQVVDAEVIKSEVVDAETYQGPS